MEEKLKQKPGDLIKVVLFGPESTGKTTLSRQLAAHYKTLWVPEYMREYLQDKWDRGHKTCEPQDMLSIAEGQMQSENRKSRDAKKILFCDTNLLELQVYSEVYYGECHPMIREFALHNTYDLYFLTYIDVPWEEDDLRDKPEEREQMFRYFEKTLKKHRRPYVVLKGDKEKRLRSAIAHIEHLIRKKQLST
ncbi:nicotinamide-nucleotide adenylyltransferase, NadR type [Sinomicrobium oceani]|uniref:Nicotinamide-nucleotide adenylyltransferase, NadR type n=1 Tax=Sinomicrobium oceani TaxID=1150368 RepID=A0A1K1N7A2_9FLAO|nr:ATP-binding protein [Sinomicrobium oceani]SFW31220.1 nicotinamide-nucleotide adenylyltransferase, NadR type [Sinomicrobium oceani]